MVSNDRQLSATVGDDRQLSECIRAETVQKKCTYIFAHTHSPLNKLYLYPSDRLLLPSHLSYITRVNSEQRYLGLSMVYGLLRNQQIHVTLHFIDSLDKCHYDVSVGRGG